MAIYDKLATDMERPEHRLLLACARIIDDSEQRDLVSTCIDTPIDWEYTLKTASMHMMTSLLSRHLDENCQEAVPQGILEKLHYHSIKSTQRHLLYSAELIRILEAFNNNNIPAIPFKGPTLGQALYEDPTLREFADLDILVEKQFVFKALKLLTELDYQNIPRYRPAVKSWILKQKNHYLLESVHGRSIVELHWSMVPSYFVLPLPINKWWERAGSVLFHEHPILTLSGEDLLVVLCIHGCKHLWRRLAWLVDIARLLGCSPELDWDYILNEYHHPDLKRIIFLSLLTVYDLLGIGLPKEFLQIARKDSTAVRLARESRERLFMQRGKEEAFRFIHFQLRLKSKWADRIRFCYRIAFTPVLFEPDIMLPRFLTPFSFGLRRVEY